jgi:hypothetical protein
VARAACASSPECAAGLATDSDGARLPWQDIATERRVDRGNARLRSRLADTIDTNAWRLLWVPPALPYYQLEGPFAEPQRASFTKRLVCLSWKCVPKVIATLVSYEAERQLIQSFEADPSTTTEARENRKAYYFSLHQMGA